MKKEMRAKRSYLNARKRNWYAELLFLIIESRFISCTSCWQSSRWKSTQVQRSKAVTHPRTTLVVHRYLTATSHHQISRIVDKRWTRCRQIESSQPKDIRRRCRTASSGWLRSWSIRLCCSLVDNHKGKSLTQKCRRSFEKLRHNNCDHLHNRFCRQFLLQLSFN
jgi:hypothetical protein